MNYEAKPGMLAMTTNMYMDRQTTDVTKQFKTTITIHLKPFISCITPEIPCSYVAGVGAPILQEEETLLQCAIYAYFPKQGFT
jgi:hypothetical protein